MRVFVTGATGFVGSAIVKELIGAGHQVVGLARSDAGAASVAAAGADVHRGTLEDLESLRIAAEASDGVIHTAFNHDFANYAAGAETDRRAIEALGAALAGSDRPVVVTAGTLGLRPGHVLTEDDPADPSSLRASETTALSLVERRVRVSVVRLSPSVHDVGDYGFVPTLIAIARQKGVSAYVADGSNRWSAVHRLDAAALFRLALEKAPAGAKLHGVGDEGIPLREIAAVIGKRLNVPVVAKSTEEAEEHFGWIAGRVAIDQPASNALTKERLGWQPTHPGLLADLDSVAYFQSEGLTTQA